MESKDEAEAEDSSDDENDGKGKDQAEQRKDELWRERREERLPTVIEEEDYEIID